MRRLILFLLLCPIATLGQTSTTGRVLEGTAAARPTSCSTGDWYYSQDTNTMNYCTSTNTWNGTVIVNAPETFPGAVTANGGGALNGSFSGPTTLTGNVTATAGQNSAYLYNLDGAVICDGIKYTTLNLAVAAAPTPGTVVVPLGAVCPVTANLTVPTNVVLIEFAPSLIAISNAVTLTINGPKIFPPAAQLFSYTGSGTAVFGPNAAAGGVDAAWFPGADILAQISNAYIASPAQGGIIFVPPPTAGGCYTATTAISLATAGKYPMIQGESTVSNGTGNVDQGVCINYTPTTATTAITLDYTPAAGGGQIHNAGIRNLMLANNACHTQGGCGSSAIGVLSGGTNGGFMAAVFDNFIVEGFSVGLSNTNGISWGWVVTDSTFKYNTTGVSCTAGENLQFRNTQFLFEGTDFSNGGCEVNINGGSMDNHSTVGINCTAAAGLYTMELIGLHEETNFGSATTHHILGSCNLSITGGVFMDDCTGLNTPFSGCTVNADYMFNLSGNHVNAHGMVINSQGRTLTNVFALGGNISGILDVYNQSPSTLTTLVQGGAQSNFISVRQSVPNSGVAPFPLQINPAGLKMIELSVACPAATASFDFLCTNSTTHAWQASYNGAAYSDIPLIARAQTWSATQTHTAPINFSALLISNTAPTIAGAGCGGSAASIVAPNGTASFKINVGTAPTTACTITMPAATTGWNCSATDITTNSTTVFYQKQTGAESTTSVTITNFSDVAAASNFTANDVLKVQCHAD